MENIYDKIQESANFISKSEVKPSNWFNIRIRTWSIS